MNARWLAVWWIVSTASACASRAAEPVEHIVAHGQFQKLHLVSVSEPRGATVLLASDASGWDARARDLAAALARAGALVVGIDTPAFLATLAANSSNCALVAGDFQNLAHFAQAYLRQPSYQPAVLVGIGTGASLSVAAQLQAPEHSFAGTIARDFCGELTLPAPLCSVANLQHSDAPPVQHFTPLHRPADPLYVLSQPACKMSAAYDAYVEPTSTDLKTLYATLARAAEQRAVRAPEALADLPVIEVPARAGVAQRDAFAIMLSGDGGWAEIDQTLSAKLAEQGVGVVGLDSLRYFWSSKDPEAAARDVDRLVSYYVDSWQRSRVMLIGFSQGADVLPFIWNRLPARARARVAATIALSLGRRAEFEFHVTNWVADSHSGRPILPEMQTLAGHNAVCVYGAKDDSSVCPDLDPHGFELVRLPGSHHFDGHYDEVAQVVMDALARAH